MKSRSARSVFLGVLLLLGLVASAAADPLFSSAYQPYPTGPEPWSLRTADFNGDHSPDLAVATAGNDSVSVLLGNGDGTFQPRVDFSVGSAPVSIAAGDVNADGRWDLAVANIAPDRVTVLLGNGDGSFGPKADFATGIDPNSVAIADLDGDGRPDLAVANYNSQTVSVLLGNGDGTFRARTDFPTGIIPYTVAIADLNADLWPDLAVVNRIGTVSVLLGRGDGTFAPGTEYAVGEDPRGMAIGDLNADGRPDLAIVNLNSTSVSVLLGRGDGTFGARTDIDIRTGGRPHSVAIADLDRDGRLDLAVANWGPVSVSVLLGNGDGTFRAPAEFPTSNVNLSVVTADFDADGRLDLAACGGGGSEVYRVSVLLGNGDGTFGARTFRTGNRPVAAAAADLDEDGIPDLVTADTGSHPDYRGAVSVLLGNGNGTFKPMTDYEIGSQCVSVRIADLNADGKPDLLALGRMSRTIGVLLGKGDGTFEAAHTFATRDYPSSIAVADLNADGHLDVAAANADGSYPTYDGTVSLLLGRGDGTFGPRSDFSVGGLSSAVAVADFNGDSRPDLVVLKYLAGTIAVLLGNGDGTFGPRTDFTTRGRADDLAITDLNADGRTDVVLTMYLEGSIGVMFGLGNGRFDPVREFFTGGYPASPAIADLDGDGRLDVAFLSDINVVSMLPGDGTGGLGGRTDYGVGWPATFAVSDLNADGRADLAVPDIRLNSVWILLNRTAPPPPISIALDFTPGTLSLDSHGRWVTGYLEPGARLSAGGINIASLRLNCTVPVDSLAPTTLGDHDGDSVPDLMVKFDRAAVELTLPEGDSVAVTVTGTLDGQPFSGTDFIRVRRGRISAPLAGSHLAGGSVTQVRWETPGGVTVQSVALRFSADGGGTWSSIARGQSNTGSFDWTVPNVPTDQARVAVLAESADETGGVEGVLAVSEAFAIGGTVGVGDAAPGQFALAIRGASNPAVGGRLRVEFALRDGSPAKLDLLDVAGRALASKQVGSFGPGRHSLDLAGGRAVRPGIYFLRLTQGGSEVRARAAVLR